jgi:uncharacterized repeat protein (TIGR03803 family)
MRNNIARMFLVALTFAVAMTGAAYGYKLRTLYSFCIQGGCADGREPASGLLRDPSGNLYGTALFGGANGVGAIYELVPNAKQTKWKYKVLYSFCTQAGCADGSDPLSNLIIDSAGNLYGTTMAGGANDGGVVYRLVPNAKHTTWTLETLYAFCSASDCVDGRLPQSDLAYAGKGSGAPYDGASPLYGTTSLAGAHHQGVVFSITPNGQSWNEQVLYDFCALANCADGAGPTAGVLIDAQGNIFGTTYYGGQGNQGTVFELSAARGGETETVLHSFCAQQDCLDGAFPEAGLIMDAAGNLFGTTFGGGSKGRNCDDIGVSGCGTAFKLVPDGDASQLTVLHDFCAKKNCTDGGYPLAGLTMDGAGHLYGATLYGGGHGAAPGSGMVFDLSAAKPLYAFCKRDDCSDGALPEGNLIQDASGNIFGTTLQGGATGNGTVFELVP